MAYPDTYDSFLGYCGRQKVYEHSEYGHKYYTIGGDSAGYCERCERLRLEDDLDDDGICSDCREEMEENRECEDEE